MTEKSRSNVYTSDPWGWSTVSSFDWLFNRLAISSSPHYTRSSASYNRSCNKDTEERLKANRRWCNRPDFAAAFCPIPDSSRQFSLTDLFLSHSQGTRRYLRSSSSFILDFLFLFFYSRVLINYNWEYYLAMQA